MSLLSSTTRSKLWVEVLHQTLHISLSSTSFTKSKRWLHCLPTYLFSATTSEFIISMASTSYTRVKLWLH